MTWDEYQVACLRTANANLGSDLFLATLGLGIAGEAGEIADTIKKVVGHGHSKSGKIAEELGDLLWYTAMVSWCYGISLSEIATRNIDKLLERYPDGFSSERSINRDDNL